MNRFASLSDAVSPCRDHGRDHASFDEGVPAFLCLQPSLDYDKRHDFQADTLECMARGDLLEEAQVLAGLADHVAQRPEILPRKPGTSGGS